MHRLNTLRTILADDPMVVIWPVAIFVLTLLAGWVARRVVLRILRAWTSRTNSRPGLILTEALRGPILIWTVIFGVHLAIEGSDLPARYTVWTPKVLVVLWIISFTIMLTRIAGNLVRYYGDQVPGALPVTTLTESLAEIAVILIGIMLILRTLGLEVTPMLTALGVGGLAVALALQDTLSNLFGGFYVAVARQIRMGDYIKLNTGEEGYVLDIGWRNTTIRAMANNLIIVPNSKLSQAIVTNYFLPEKKLGSNLQITVNYSADPDRIEQLLLEVSGKAVLEIPGLLNDPAPSVAMDPGFMDSGLGLTLNYQVADFASQGPVRNELRKRIYHRFREEGVELPYPTRTIFLKSEPGAPPL